MKGWLVAAGWGLAITVLAALNASVATWLFHLGWIAPSTAFVVERAVAGVHAAEPLQGLALVYPPLPVLVYAALVQAPLASAVVATLATASLLWFAFHRMQDPLSAIFAGAALLVPPVLIDAVGAAPFWCFAAIVAWSLYMVARYVENEYSLYLFQAGLLIALAFFIDVRIGFFAAVLGLGLLALYATRNQWRRGLCIALVLLFPIAYFTLSWGFVQWIFTGHPWMPLPPLGLRPFAQAYPVALLFVFILGCIAVSPRARSRSLHLAIFASVPLVAALCAMIGRSFSAGEAVLVGVGTSLAAITQIGNVWLRRFAAFGTLLACIALAYVLPAPPPQHLDLSIAAPATYAPALGNPSWEQLLTIARYAIALGLACGVVLLARHSLRRLTGRTL